VLNPGSWHIKNNRHFRLTLTHPAQYLLRSIDHIILDDGVLLYFSIDACYQSRGCFPFTESIRARKSWSYGSKLVEGLGVEKLATGLLRELKDAA
jgi:hypothetical protein